MVLGVIHRSLQLSKKGKGLIKRQQLGVAAEEWLGDIPALSEELADGCPDRIQRIGDDHVRGVRPEVVICPPLVLTAGNFE